MPYKDNEMKKQNHRDWRRRCREARRCIRCGINLIDGEGLCCVNCSTRNIRQLVTLSREGK